MFTIITDENGNLIMQNLFFLNKKTGTWYCKENQSHIQGGFILRLGRVEFLTSLWIDVLLKLSMLFVFEHILY